MTKIRHDVMLRLVKVLDVVMITLPFAACWVWYYAAKTPLDGTWQGHAVILGLYAVLFILLGKTYDAFWMSMQRVSELMYGQFNGSMPTARAIRSSPSGLRSSSRCTTAGCCLSGCKQDCPLVGTIIFRKQAFTMRSMAA